MSTAGDANDVTGGSKQQQQQLSQEEQNSSCRQQPISGQPQLTSTSAADGDGVQRTNSATRGSDAAVTQQNGDGQEEEEEAVARTTRTEKSGDGGRTTTTMTTTTHRTKDGPRLVTKQTRQITRVGGIGSTNYTINKSQADEIASRLATGFQLKSVPGLSGMITVRTETWNSTDGVTVRSQKSRAWQADGNELPSDLVLPSTDAVTDAEMSSSTRLPAASLPQTRPTVHRSATSIKQVLLDWIKARVENYEHVNVTNLSTSWSDGLAFCALIHSFYPDSFDYKQLSPVNRRHNLQLAFETAQKYANIDPLLDVDDMLSMPTPDWRCVFTYLQSFYRRLAAPSRPSAVGTSAGPTSGADRAPTDQSPPDTATSLMTHM